MWTARRKAGRYFVLLNIRDRCRGYESRKSLALVRLLFCHCLPLPQVVEHQPAEQQEYDHPGRKDPFVLFGASFHHANRIPADAQRVGHAVQALLGRLEHLALLAQVAQDSLAAGNVFVQGLVGCGEEVLLPQSVCLASIVPRGKLLLLRLLARLKRRVGRVGVGIVGVGILGRRVVRPALAQQIGAVALVNRVVAGLLQHVDLDAKRVEVLAELAGALLSLLLLLGHNLLAGEGGVLVDGLGEGGDGGGHVADLGGRRGLPVGQDGQLAADGLALPQGGIVGDVLRDVRGGRCVSGAGNMYVP